MVYSVKSSNDFEKQLNGATNKVVLIDFFANWCGPCKMMEPVLSEMENKYGERLMIMKVNVDKLESIADWYKVSSLPTFVLYKNGKKSSSFTGADEYKLKQKIAKLV